MAILVNLEPFVSLAHVRVSDGGFQESGGVSALAVVGGSADANFATAGVRWSVGGEQVQLTGSLATRRASGFDDDGTQAVFANGGDRFTIRGLPLDGSAIEMSIGGRFELTDRARVWVGYESLMADDADNDGLQLRFHLDL